MDSTLAEVAKNCAMQLQVYQDCVNRNPKNWESACIQQKKALTKCSEDHVPVLKFVKSRCSAQISGYDTCLSENASEPEKCIDALKELYFCTEAASAAFKMEEQKKETEKD
ncbi:uncharacterized protein VTP21DRAFT_11216 [Calcarisporiella thermophila]|uniref:uncharacterized protein n=1 Tax=Calcarisporiella thermophila TaxID=911321 RepID=UPI0037424209